MFLSDIKGKIEYLRNVNQASWLTHHVDSNNCCLSDLEIRMKWEYELPLEKKIRSVEEGVKQQSVVVYSCSWTTASNDGGPPDITFS
jgi:hypothetical protein